MEFIIHPYFLNFGVPLITAVLSVFIKCVTRNDNHTSFRKEDLAVGLDLSVTGVLIYITGSVQLARSVPVSDRTPDIVEKITIMPWILLAMMVGMWGVSTIVRKFGWASDQELTIICGMIVPNVFGLAILLLAVNWV
ncbi:hypothetical protein QTG64_004289 [Vibrio vulnificus]|nr:hypothetical protein [Vibrio vulnificus]EJC6821949.1 hypothetical protein [Vibrio vulnificus]EJC6955651.1 hypothetical protein [Vibrio vulnificus]EJC6960317.1 hypothetical protein [Vibrio vulnificus]EKQ3696644.1 hypothetical protein [Vibrio vulnificus]